MPSFSLLNFSFSIAAFLLAFLILVGVHEFGHFIVARLCNVKILRFSIGFGKALWCWYDKKGTEYVFAIFPLGGYVKMLDEREAPVAKTERPLAFNHKPIWQRFFIVIAGVGFNIIFAILAFWYVFAHGVIYIKPVVGSVIPNSIAARAGLKPGEEIIAVDGRRTYHWATVSMALVTHYGEQGTLKLTVRDPHSDKVQQREIAVDLRQWHLDALRPNPLLSIGIVRFQRASTDTPWPRDMLVKRHYSILAAVKPAIQETYYFIAFNLIILYKIITGIISWRSLGGPVSIIEAAVLAAGQGLVIYMNFLALLSVSVAVINLLPIPGLDGSQLVYLLYERIRGKPVSVAVQVLAFRLGIILLLIILIQALANDLLRLAT